jgi:hypothetical protein
MPETQTATHPTGLTITFHEGPHSYIDANGQHYESGTTFVGRFKPKFDPDGEILKRKAAEAGVTTEELARDWKRRGDQASLYGTRCHANSEFQFKREFSKIHRGLSPLEENSFRLIWDYVTYLNDNLTYIATEQIVFSPRYALAGSIDLLMADHPNRTLWILDWKSNKEIRRDNHWDGRMLPPLSYLHDCHFVHYTLQLETYTRLIRDEGYLPASGIEGYTIRKALLWIPHMGDAIEFIELPDAGREVAEMLIHKFTEVPF